MAARGMHPGWWDGGTGGCGWCRYPVPANTGRSSTIGQRGSAETARLAGRRDTSGKVGPFADT